MRKRIKLLLSILLVPLLLCVCRPALAEDGEFSSLQELDGKRVGVQTGTPFDKMVLDNVPNAQISYFNTTPDMAEALTANKIDAFPGDEPVLKMIAAEHEGMAVLSDSLDAFEFGIVLPKSEAGDRLKQEFDEWIRQIKDSGDLTAITKKWVEGPEAEKTLLDYKSLPATNGTLTMMTEGTYPPMDYYRDGEVVGMEVELAALFCESHGYGLVVEVTNFDGILPAIQAGKADFAMSGFSITDERKESVNFSEAYYQGDVVMAVRKAEQGGVAAGEEGGGSFWDEIKDSFAKTFLREDRWKLFVEGVGTTLLITVLSVILGTILGFLVFELRRKGGPVADTISVFLMRLLQGMPMVVLLLILYYVVFRSFSIGGVVVSIVGFTLTFGASVHDMLKMGVGAVDDGQREAALAMGYTDGQTFFKIILPQALPHVMPAFRGAIIDLIKATSIVGYIAVQDLAKMGDIVRSRTYEAFFPLIAVTVIYFALEALLGFVAGRVERSVDPKRRSREKVLKGVKTDD